MAITRLHNRSEALLSQQKSRNVVQADVVVSFIFVRN
jgi:hypothetical protein